MYDPTTEKTISTAAPIVSLIIFKSPLIFKKILYYLFILVINLKIFSILYKTNKYDFIESDQFVFKLD